jgi:co-chaperonin GroES (HSP10)
MIKQRSTDFELLDGRILLKKDVTSQKGTILLPKEEKDQTAIVVSSSCPDIRAGFRVLIGQFTGTEYEFEDGVFTMCLREHIMGVQVRDVSVEAQMDMI